MNKKKILPDSSAKVDKKIIFKDTTKNHIDLKINLQYHNLNISKFFRSIVKAINEKDELMIEFLDKLKNGGKIKNITQRQKIKQMEKDAAEVSQQFGLDSADIENIYDILEQEHGDL